GRRVAVELFWVALDGRVFQLTGVAPARSGDEDRPVLVSGVETFGRLTPEERGRIEEHRIRLGPARQGEAAAALVLRTKSPWKDGRARRDRERPRARRAAPDRPRPQDREERAVPPDPLSARAARVSLDLRAPFDQDVTAWDRQV